MSLILLLLFGGIAGILAGYLGIGGGILMVPMFSEHLRLKGVDIDQATLIAAASSLAVTFVNAGTVAIERWRKKEMLFSAIPPVLIGSFAGSFIGAWIASSIPGKTVRLIFGIFLVLTALQLAFEKKTRQNSVPEKPVNPWLLTGLGVLTGIVSALLGIGGGVLMVPAFILIFHIHWTKASGTSSAIASVTALIGVVGYIILSGDRLGDPGLSWSVIDWRAAIPTGLAATMTARYGTHLSRKFGGGAFRIVFSALLVILAARMLLTLN